MRLPGFFEIAARQHDAQFARQIGKAGDQRVALHRCGQGKVFRALFDAEIGRGEQFLHQNHPGALCCGLTHL